MDAEKFQYFQYSSMKKIPLSEPSEKREKNPINIKLSSQIPSAYNHAWAQEIHS